FIFRTYNFIFKIQSGFSFFFHENCSHICCWIRNKKSLCYFSDSLKIISQKMLEQTKKTANDTWNKCLTYIKDNVDSQAFTTWFEPISAIELEEKALYIQVPSKFFYEWLEEHYVTVLKSALNKVLGSNAKLIYKINMENSSGAK